MAETVEVATNVLDDSLDESKASNDSKEELNEKSKETSLELEEKEESTELTKTDEDATMDETDEDKKERAVRQIEFYFSDSNLPYDKFMWTLHTAKPDHWMPIKTIASFKRMREFIALGEEWIIEALKTSMELEVDETNTNVRRRTEVTAPKGQFERSIYAKGFGSEESDSQQKLEKFFNKYGRVNAVRMRRDDEKKFKGSVFVEFADMSAAERFLSTDPKPSWNGSELVIMSKEAYCEMKIKEKGLSGRAAKAHRERSAQGPTNSKGFNAFRDMAKHKKETEKEKKPEIYLEFMGKKLRVNEKDGGSVEDDEIPYVKGSALRFKGDLANESIRFENFKDPLKERFGRPPFIKYSRGNDWGLLGFDKALSEEDVEFVRQNLKIMNGKELTWTAAGEDEEKAFLTERAQNAAKRAFGATLPGKNTRGRGGARGGRGGRGGGGHRNAPRSNEVKSDSASGKEKSAGTESQAGEKRKRAVEPDGGPDTGIRGAGIPAIMSAKRSKTEASDS